MSFLESETGHDLPTYLVDNYGIVAAEAFFEWRSLGSTLEDAAVEVIRRFPRLPLLTLERITPEEQRS